jgi:hypothetical protein
MKGALPNGAHPRLHKISHWMPPAGKCLRHIAPVAAMVNNFNAKHKALTKTIFS